MRAVFIGGPRHREEQTLFDAMTMSIGEYDRISWLNKRDYDEDDGEPLAYFVLRGMDEGAARASIGKHLRDEPEPNPPA